MDYTQILLRPVVTEKATILRDSTNHVSFIVHPDANKIEIKKAVEKMFNVRVLSVNVIMYNARKRKKNRRIVHVSGWRKAYVKLAIGEKIAFFEGV